MNLEIQNAERDYDLNHAAELKYGTLINLQKQLKEAEETLEQQVGAPGQTHSAHQLPQLMFWTDIDVLSAP